jgi:DNA polymerase
MSLEEQIRGCVACPELAATRTTVVVGTAPPQARLLVVGEAPGALEDETGLPFVGRSGQLLNRLLAEAGLPRERVAVLNTVKCRPPGNRLPTRTETANCRHWTSRQLEVLDPDLVVTLGLSAATWFLGRTTLTAVRGRVHEVGGRRVLPTYHPAAAAARGPRHRGGPGHVKLATVDDTKAFGRQLATRLRPGDLVILSGPLGAGKTALVQGIGEGLGVSGRVTSPTFVIARVHRGPLPLVHVDAYRLRGDGRIDLDDLEIDEELDRAVVVVEWGEGVVEQLSDSHLEVRLERHDDESRTATVTGVGPRWS